MTKLTASADRGLRPERAAEIIVGLSGGGRRGSGYLVAPGRVLTAAHVVAGADGIRVRFQADRPGERVVEAVVAWAHDGIDVAVLVLSGDTDEDVAPVSYGTVGDQDAVLGCTAMGFPRFKLRTDAAGRRFRDAEHMDARCAVLANRREGTLDLRITAPLAEDPDPERDAWEGMSGAAVFSGGHLVGVVSRHHPREGTGRVAAGRVDRWADAMSAREQAGLEGLLGQDLAELPSAVPGSALGLVQEFHRAQLADVAPPELTDRECELRDLVSFCVGSEPYLWLQGPPWAGKTALVSWFAQNPPHGVVPVWFFITARNASQSDSEAYTAAVIDQLTVIAGCEPAGNGSAAARDGERRFLLRQAAERVAQEGGTLLLVVDALDEDQSQARGGDLPSVASLLPERLPPNVRVLVTSRTSPGLPGDVSGAHPLRHCRVVKLSATEGARHTEYEARFDLGRALSGDQLQRDLVGFLTAARGTLTADDVRDLTGEPSYDLRRRLDSEFGRILRLRGGFADADGGGDVGPHRSSRGYLFAHETLLTTAQDVLGPEVADYLERLHAWADSYKLRAWPEDTPPYLLQSYGRLLVFHQETDRAAAFATDARRRDRFRELTGSDGLCLAEIAAAQETVRRFHPDELGALAALATAGAMVARRNVSLHRDIPAAYARLGRTRHAIGLARSVFRPLDRAQALAGVARVLSEAGDRRAVGLADEAVQLAKAMSAERFYTEDSFCPVVTQGVLATALARDGRGDEAVRLLHGLRRQPPRPPFQDTVGPFGDPEAGLFTEALVTTAAALQDPMNKTDVLRLAEHAGDVESPSDRVRALVAVADAWTAGGFDDEAARLHRSVLRLVREHAGSPDNLAAVAATALHERHPRMAQRLASLAMAETDGHRHTGLPDVDRRATYGTLHRLVAARRMAEADVLADTLEEADEETLRADTRLRREAWRAVAEGWAREGEATAAWKALEKSGYVTVAIRDGGVAARLVGLLTRAGAAEQTEAVLTAQNPAEWAVAGALAALAGHFAADDPERSLRLLRTAEQRHRAADGPAFHVPAGHLVAFAGALATVDRPDEAEQLVESIDSSVTRAWGCAAVSIALTRSDTGRARRLAERAADLSYAAEDSYDRSDALIATARALGWAGARERLSEVIGKLKVAGNQPFMGHEHACLEAAAGLWPHDPDLAGRLVDDVTPRMRIFRREIMQLLVAVGHHDSERSASIRQILHDRHHPGRPYSEPYSDRVLHSMFTATTAPAAARRELDEVEALYESQRGTRRPLSASSPWDYFDPATMAIARAVLGDYEAALAVARREEHSERRAETLAYLAAYAACVPVHHMPVPRHADNRNLPFAHRLAALLFPPASGPDVPRARALLAEALTTEGWHTAVPVLASIDPKAVLRVRDVVFAHLDFGD
ncbi:trypsin-like peptidase domain-containing protein [Streptomyces sp. NPDC005525]|uniref:trypsin-like peptidase domain-containing protein n=1 Tax=Streptomyces sp. NPDC005525 TaxID=3364720 RepID=UPI0036BE2FB1